MKKTDYTVNLGILKKNFRRGVKVNDFSGNVEVVLSLNHNKGLIETSRKVVDSFHVDDDTVFAAIQQAFNELEDVARSEGLVWRNNWRAARRDEEKESGNDADQLGLPLDGEE